MAKQIKRNDILEDDLFKNLVKSAEESITKLKGINSEFKILATSIKSTIQNADFSKMKGLNQFVKATKEATKLSKEQAKIKQELNKAEALISKLLIEQEKVNQQKIKTQREQIKLDSDLKRQKERLIKEEQKAVKVANDEANAYKKLQNNTRDLKNESKKLGAEMLLLEQSGKKNTKQYRELENQYKKVTRSAKQGDKALKKLDSTVGDNFRNVGNYKSALGGLTNLLSQFGLAMGVGAISKDAIGVVKNYEQSNAKLSAILQTTAEKTESLQKIQRKLGGSTKFTASEVADLQIELAKLGFSQDQIEQSTESVLKLALASGTDLARASEVSASTLRAFGLEAKDIDRVANVMGASFVTTGLDMEKFAEAMKYVAPVSKKAGVSIEETSAMLGVLANNGISGSQAGTSLRQVLSEMDATGKSTSEALKDLSEKGLDLAGAQEEVGKNAKTSLLVLLDQLDTIPKLTKKYENAEGVVDEMADTMQNTLGGAMDKLRSAFEEQILKMNETTSIGNALKNTFEFLAENLGTIFSILGKVLKLWITYKAVAKATLILNQLQIKSFKDLYKSLITSAKGFKNLGKAQREAGKSSSGFGKALKGIGMAVAINLAIELASAIYDIAKGYDVANEKQIAFERTSKQLERNQSKLQSQTDEQIEKERKRLEILVNRGELENKVAQQEFKNFLLKKEFVRTESDFETRTEKDVYENLFDKIRNERSELQKQIKLIDAEIRNLENDPFKNRLKIADAEGRKQALKTAIQNNIDYTNSLKEQLYQTELIIEAKDSDIDTDIEGKKTKKELKTEYDKLNKSISEQKNLLHQIQQIENQRNLRGVDIEAENKFKEELDKAILTGEVEVENFERILEMKSEIQKDYLKDNLTFTIENLNEEFNIRKNKLIQDLEEERIELLKQKDLTEEKKLQIELNYKKKKEELDQNLLIEYTDLQTKIKVETEKSAEELLTIEAEKNNKINEYNDEINDALEGRADNQNNSAKDLRNKDLEDQKNYFDQINQLAKLSSDFFIKQSDRKIKRIEAEKNALEKQSDFLKELAVEGNISAKESLALNEKLQIESNQKKEKELRKQEKIKVAMSVFDAYSRNSTDPKVKNPAVKTISDISVLTAFINSLPTFYEGTETTVAEALGKPNLSGKDGHIVRVDGSEKVLNPKLSKMTGNLTTNEIAKISEDRIQGKLLYSNENNSSNTDLMNSILINKLDTLNSTIKNKPENKVEVSEVVGGVMHIIETTKKGNMKVRNIRRFN